MCTSPMDPDSSSSSTAANLRRMDRERLRRYVADIVRIQSTPLRDVVVEHVLPRLPAQSLHRLRAVSRSWHSHISSPFFAHTHSHAHRSPSGIFFHASNTAADDVIVTYLPFDPYSDSVPDPSLSFIPGGVSLLASSNGLVACKPFHVASGGQRPEPQNYYICNPATRKWTAIPSRTHWTDGGCALVFHPTALNFSADFHLIVGVHEGSGLDVFSSTTGTWQRSMVRAPKELGRGVAVGGRAYWRAKDNRIASYDPASDKLSLIETPATAAAAAEIMRWQLGEVSGKLCCIGGMEGLVEVYELEPKSATWRKRAAVEVDGNPWPLICEGTDNVIVIWMDGLMVRIDLISREWTVMGIEAPKECVDGVPYISSLVAVKELPGYDKGDACHMR